MTVFWGTENVEAARKESNRDFRRFVAAIFVCAFCAGFWIWLLTR